MDLLDSFRLLARYNRSANASLYAQCALLDENEYRKQRQVSFGSIHALLNHMLLGDQIWMARFQGGGRTTPPLNTILFDSFASLREAREKQDDAIVCFFAQAESPFLDQPLRYTSSLGQDREDRAPNAVLHFFNHQTHHRGQVHAMLSQTDVKPPSLDLHRLMNP